MDNKYYKEESEYSLIKDATTDNPNIDKDENTPRIPETLSIFDKSAQLLNNFGNPALDTDPLGDMSIYLKGDPDLVAWSDVNQNWHIKSGRDSRILVTIDASNVETKKGIYFIRLTLVKRNQKYREIKVDTLCDKHAVLGNLEDKLRTIQYADDNNFYWYTSGSQRSLCAGCPWPTDGYIKMELTIKFICMDTCHNSSEATKIKEKARDLLLVATLEHKDFEKHKISVLGRIATPIWPKNTIATRELQKITRRLPKGQRKGVKKRVNFKLQRLGWAGFDNLCKTNNLYGQSIGLSNSDIIARLKKWQDLDLMPQKQQLQSKDHTQDQTTEEQTDPTWIGPAQKSTPTSWLDA